MKARPRPVPARIQWAVEQLPLRTRDALLEVGCGSGQALALLSRRIERARLTGVDRSALQLQRARQLNAQALANGTLRLEQLTLQAAGRELEAGSFATVLAINVNAFWTEGAAAFAAARRLLRGRGRLWLVYEPPTASVLAKLAPKLQRLAEGSGLRLHDTRQAQLRRSAVLGLVFGEP